MADVGAVLLRAELVARIAPFLNRSWHSERTDRSNVHDLAQQLEDVLVASGRLITIETDEEYGLAIGAEGHEH